MEKLNRRGIVVIASGIRPGQRQVLDSVGALDLLHPGGREYATTPEAINAARAPLESAGLLTVVPAQKSHVTVTDEETLC